MSIFNTRPRFQDRDIRQLSGDTITLSGGTKITGTFNYVPGAVTGYVLKALNNQGEVYWAPAATVSADTNTFVTGGTLSGTDLILGWNTGGSTTPIDLSALSDTFTGGTGNCITDLYVTNIHGCSPITIWDNLQNVTSTANTTTTYTNVFGNNNLSNSNRTLIGGGKNNTITIKSDYSTISNGLNSYIFGYHNFIASGTYHVINGGIKGSNSILGGRGNQITATTIYSTINSGKNNIINGGNYHIIGGGSNNSIENGEHDVIGGGSNNSIQNTDPSYNFIGGGQNNSLTGSVYSTIIGGRNNLLKHSDSHIIGSNITSSEVNTTYVENLTVVDDYILHSDVIRVSDISSLSSQIKGSITNFDWSGITNNLLWNSNPFGSTTFFFGNFDNWPTEKKYGFFSYYNSGFTRSSGSTTGPLFYQDKVVIKGSDDINGMVINPKAGDANATLWFEIGGESAMILKGDGIDSGYLGIGLNPDGTEFPTERLQIGGTGTTGNILINGDINMCSLSTGNTLFTSSISGCSPVTIQGHTTFDNNNFYGPQRPNYISEIITSASTGWSGSSSSGIYTGITIESGWVVEEIQYFIKVKDSNAGGGLGNLSRLVVNTVNDNIPNGGFVDDDWNITYEGFSENSILPLRSSVIQDPVGIYFTSSDNLIIRHQDPTEAPVGLTDGEFRVLIKYWNGNGVL